MGPILAVITMIAIIGIMYYMVREDFPTEKPKEYDQILGRFNMILNLYKQAEVLSRAEEQHVKDIVTLIQSMKRIGGYKTAKDMQRRWDDVNRIKRKV